MDLGMITISATLILLVVVPLTLMQLQKRKKEQAHLNALKSLSKQHHCSLTHYDLTSDFAIGIDQVAKALFFYKNTAHENRSKHIALKNYSDCKISEERQNTKNTTLGDITALSLTLTPRDNSITPEYINFYNSDENYQLNGEIDLIKKWNGLLASTIK